MAHTTINIALNPMLHRELMKLVQSGLHGASMADACERLICEGILRNKEPKPVTPKRESTPKDLYRPGGSSPRIENQPREWDDPVQMYRRLWSNLMGEGLSARKAHDKAVVEMQKTHPGFKREYLDG